MEPRRDVVLAPYTTFGIGGPARHLADARSAEELAGAVAWGRGRGLRTLVLGGGSNVLVDDRGFDGLVVLACGAARIELLAGGRIRAEAGARVSRLIDVALAHGLSGLEHFAGIPASLGGAVRQNLHFLSPDRTETVFLGDLVEEARVLGADGVHRVPASQLAFGYDSSSLQGSGEILLEATLRLVPGDRGALARVRDANLAWRAERHPVAAERRSAGCVFRNPDGASAARLVDEAGLKGLRVGEAAVSRRHANFVLNLGGATADDVRRLVERVQDEVERRSGVRLEPEIELLGTAPQ